LQDGWCLIERPAISSEEKTDPKNTFRNFDALRWQWTLMFLGRRDLRNRAAS
jgi:hypothetical protein